MSLAALVSPVGADSRIAAINRVSAERRCLRVPITAGLRSQCTTAQGFQSQIVSVLQDR